MISGSEVGLEAFALLTVSTTHETSIVGVSVHAMILREYRSMMLVRLYVSTLIGPDIRDISAPHGIWTRRAELFVKDVMKLSAEVRITGCGDPVLYPLGTDSHNTHVFTYGTY